MATFSRKDATELLTTLPEVATGKFFSVEFTKKDGELRRMQCRIGVKKGIKGTGRKGWPDTKAIIEQKGLLPVWDSGIKDYRFVNLETLEKVVSGGVTYTP